MAKIEESVIEHVLASADIVALIGEDVALRKQGVNYVGLCPFHGDRTPSLTVSPSKRIYKCFACGEGGNVITWFQKIHGLSFPEAVREVGRRCGVEVPQVEQTPEELAAEKKREALRAVLRETENIFAANLVQDDKAKSYLLSRGVGQDDMNRFNIGSASAYNALSKVLLQRGFTSENIVSSGVAVQDGRGQLRDTWWGRVMFPFYDYRGRVVSFTGRDITGEQAAKYKNGPETAIFKKDHHIFGLWQARQAIAREGCVYVCEGQMDVVSLSRYGVQNAVAASGTAFSEHQRKLLHAQTGRVILLLDGDAAGTKAAMKHIPALVAADFEVLCVALPDGMDPDDLARKHGEEVGKVLKKRTQSYVAYLSSKLFSGGDDAYSRRSKVQQVVSVIAMERDETLRRKFLSELSRPSGYDLDELGSILRESKLPERPETFHAGFYGLEFAASYIHPDLRELHLVRDFPRFQKLLGEEQPYVYVHGIPSHTDIQELARGVEKVIFHRPDMTADDRHESEDIRLMKELFTFGLTVDVSTEGKISGFLYAYVRLYGGLIELSSPTPEQKNTYISRVAEMISYAPAPIQTVNMSTWAEILNLKVTALKEVLKPFAQERKANRKFQGERTDYGDVLEFDTEKIPDYVASNEEYARMLRRYNFYPLLNTSGEPVCYMFRGESGNLRRVADFYMTPLFHIYSDQSEDNRRVVKLTSLFLKGVKYVEFPSKVFAKMSTLNEKLIEKGAYNMEGCTAADYAKIWACMSYNFPLVNEIKVFGQQEEGCFLFSNGVLHEVDGAWQFDYADELGLMAHGDMLFYSPAFSKVNSGMRKDADRYEQDRWLMYTETPKNKRITFARWAELMDEVYKINDNGKWAVIYAIMCAFRSDIYPINRLFTAIFFIGPTMSGKTQIAVSIRSLYIKPDAPAFNLNSGTDAAFFSVLERFRDVPQIMEEYNDDMISDNKFQGLKSVTYDGDGKQKRKAATGNDIETSKVNAPVILLGQESPQKDDNALSNRVVLCEVPKRDEINEDHARAVFEELKDAEKAGLSYLLVEVLKLRPVVREHFLRLQKECVKELLRDVEASGTRSGDQTRVINTVSMFLAMCRILTTYAPNLPLPFTYERFKVLAVEKIRKQVDMLTKTDKLAMFFNTIDYLIDAGKLKPGRDIKIEQPGRPIRLKGGRDYLLPSSDTRLLYMNLSNVHKMYASAMQGGDKPLSLTTLEVNLNSHPSFVGVVSGTRFRWQETEEVPSGGFTAENGHSVPDTSMKKVVRPREKITSAMVLNYDVLKAVMGIDFERSERGSVPEATQQDLPF